MRSTTVRPSFKLKVFKELDLLRSQEIRKVRTEVIMSGDGVYMANTYFTPSIDTFRIEDSVLPGEPSAVIKEGARVPVMLGVTSGEAGQLIALSMRGTDFVRSSGELNLDGIISPRLYTNYKQVQRVVEERYSGGNMQVEEENEIRNLFTRISTDHNFKAPAAREALFYASNHLTVYAYIFHKENAELMQRVYSQGMKGVGAVHGNDCVYIFNATILSDPSVKRVDWSEEDEKLRQRLTQQMVDFARKPSLMNSDFEPFTALHRIATPIYGPHHSPPEEFFTNISNFWYGTVRSVDLLPLEPEYKVLLQSCTMCGYPYKVPFYIMLSIMIVLLVALAVFFFRRQFVQKAVLYKLAAITSDGFRKA
ncbi:hypothetical protein AB6A40_004957 [Gnathostoma spinigerum]|uniref:Carboxylesterase type B domain-containing protein n=1 Tax=Gnathostoma spinigerum TaxID=75299 RepID=A0ABD6EE26_9BILA